MKIRNATLIFSPSDLSNHINCNHLTKLNKQAAFGDIKKPIYTTRVITMLQERGLEFEADYLKHLQAEGKTIVTINTEDYANAEFNTIRAMKNGADVIYQARLVEKNQWEGWADFLIKTSTPSELGNWSYEVVDTKLATETRATTILQIALYSEKVSQIQGVMPEYMRVQKPDGQTAYRVDEYMAYVRLAKKRFMQALLAENLDTYPEPTQHCDICNWWETCNNIRRKDDHLGFIAGMGSLQTKEMRTHNVDTMTQMANVPLPIPFKPSRGSVQTYAKIREQARVQHTARTENTNIYETLEMKPNEGLHKLPSPSEGDIYFDLEGDPLVKNGGLEYLFGWYCEEKYYPMWAENENSEKQAFEKFMDFVYEKLKTYPTLHIYHYAPYETTALKRLMCKYSTKEEEVDNLLRNKRFVDLYGVVRQSIRASIEKYSIKDLEKFYKYSRQMNLRDLSKIKAEYEYLLETYQTDKATELMRDTIQLYNQDDCVSTYHLQQWLEDIRKNLIDQGIKIERPLTELNNTPERINEYLERITPIMNALLDGVSMNSNERSDIDQANYTLAHMLNWYRREKKAFFWELFRLRDMPIDELMEESKGIAYLSYTNQSEPIARSTVYTYAFPPQDCDLKIGDNVQSQKSISAGMIQDIDTIKGLVKLKIGNASFKEHPESIFSLSDTDTTIKENAIIAFSEWVRDNGIDSKLPNYKAGRDLLLKRKPQTLKPVVKQNNTTEWAIDWASNLNHSYLAIQGPPGTGKSYTASQLIIDLVKNKNKKIGITALSHKVITGLLEKIYAEDTSIRIIQKTDTTDLPWQTTNKNEKVIEESNNCHIIAGTSFMWSRNEFANTVDYLFIDEAGQLALIDTLAMAGCCRNMILLGDPQQLQQPQQGIHPEGNEVSALAHIMNNKLTIDKEQGIFLERTWRMHPAICAFDSEQFYENKLQTMDFLQNQQICGNTPFAGSGLFHVTANHTANTNASTQEVEIITTIVNNLTNGSCTWIDEQNKTTVLRRQDIKIISPYNAQVQKLQQAIEDVAIGTVDKFQGQEAPVIIYSVATSSPEDAPRGMEFLYSPNRFNVAVSRARAVFIMVANESIFQPLCKNPEQIKLANPFCRFIELAKKVQI